MIETYRDFAFFLAGFLAGGTFLFLLILTSLTVLKKSLNKLTNKLSSMLPGMTRNVNGRTADTTTTEQAKQNVLNFLRDKNSKKNKPQG